MAAVRVLECHQRSILPPAPASPAGWAIAAHQADAGAGWSSPLRGCWPGAASTVLPADGGPPARLGTASEQQVSLEERDECRTGQREPGRGLTKASGGRASRFQSGLFPLLLPLVSVPLVSALPALRLDTATVMHESANAAHGTLEVARAEVQRPTMRPRPFLHTSHTQKDTSAYLCASQAAFGTMGHGPWTVHTDCSFSGPVGTLAKHTIVISLAGMVRAC